MAIAFIVIMTIVFYNKTFELNKYYYKLSYNLLLFQ